MPKSKHLIQWVMSHTCWTQGNNLAETRLTIRYDNGLLRADTVCVNEYGSVYGTERYLDVPCPKCFQHLFNASQVLVFDI